MITLALTNFNRTELLFESFRDVLEDPRVSEIVIVDDCSDPTVFNTIAWFTKEYPKVKLFRNEVNLDCYRNKREAVEKATNEWVILFDSDNIMSRKYIDRIENLVMAGLNEKTLYNPSFALPHFNFTRYAGQIFNRRNVANFIDQSAFSTMLNAMNYFVNRTEYLKVWDGSIDPVTSDSLYQNYNWLKSGNSIYVVPELEYYHRVDAHNGEEESHYKQNNKRTPRGFHEDIIQRIKELK